MFIFFQPEVTLHFWLLRPMVGHGLTNFGRLDNLILTRGEGADYAHHISTCPIPFGFSDLPTVMLPALRRKFVHIPAFYLHLYLQGVKKELLKAIEFKKL